MRRTVVSAGMRLAQRSHLHHHHNNHRSSGGGALFASAASAFTRSSINKAAGKTPATPARAAVSSSSGGSAVPGEKETATTTARPIRRRAPVPAAASGGGGGVVVGKTGVVEDDTTGTTTETTEDGDVSVVVKISDDDGVARAFNRFARATGGVCSEPELRLGAEQVYYSMGAVNGLFAEHTKPSAGTAMKLETAKILAAAEEARKLIGAELLPEKQWKPRGVHHIAPPPHMNLEQRIAAVNDVDAAQQGAVQRVVNGITSLLPVTHKFAESFFTAWSLQKDKKLNIFQCAAPNDYVINSKLAVFVRFDNPQVFYSDMMDTPGCSIEINFMSDYLVKRHAEKVKESGHAAANARNDDTGIEGPSITLKARANEGTEAGTTLLNGAATATTATSPISEAANAAAAAAMSVKATAPSGDATESDSATATETAAAPPLVEDVLTIAVNKTAMPNIPSDALACVLLTLDVVVPPERFAPNYEWFYNRIVGHDSEFERIAAARVFAINAPKSVATLFDFVTRMFTGKPVEFMFSKTIGSMIGLPENVSECPPATRKLLCLYLDPTKKWVLSDIMNLNLISTTAIKIPEPSK